MLSPNIGIVHLKTLDGLSPFSPDMVKKVPNPKTHMVDDATPGPVAFPEIPQNYG